MTDVCVYLVRRCSHNHQSVESVWWTEGEARTEAWRLANEDAREAGEAGEAIHPTPVRVQLEVQRLLIQKAVSRYPGAKSVEWHTLRHYSVLRREVSGSAVHRLAELVS